MRNDTFVVAPTMKHTSHITVALVDDHKIFRQGLIEVLNHLGYTVAIEASNGRELLEKLENRDLPTICILDIHMPEMDGFETTRQLSSKYPGIKILAFSTDNTDVSVSKVISCGAHGFLEKGGSLEDISGSLTAILDGSSDQPRAGTKHPV
ncbi:MAG: response regulator transcription factor [Chitinophagaceae bacterium]|nr:MAG: response regulator transcription factor [Chitinophagaceae bacterium]